MSNKKPIKKPVNQKPNSLLLVAIAVAALALVVVFIVPEVKQNNATVKETSDNKSQTDSSTTETSTTDNSSDATSSDGAGVQAPLNENGDVVIQIADITETATFYEYESNGTPMGLFAVKASDGTIRTALNTCQVCNGSPYAFFKQIDDTFQCQNCGNIYSLDMIEQERGGCNPVPIMKDEKTVTDTEIIIPATFLDDNAAIFENWKKF